jgi:hypothetical protein
MENKMSRYKLRTRELPDHPPIHIVEDTVEDYMVIATYNNAEATGIKAGLEKLVMRELRQ